MTPGEQVGLAGELAGLGRDRDREFDVVRAYE